jgi:hypothetical protein
VRRETPVAHDFENGLPHKVTFARIKQLPKKPGRLFYPLVPLDSHALVRRMPQYVVHI